MFTGHGASREVLDKGFTKRDTRRKHITTLMPSGCVSFPPPDLSGKVKPYGPLFAAAVAVYAGEG